MNVIGDPLVLYCRPASDFLPHPQACLVTGITLTAVGAGVDNSSLRNAGIITAIPSAIGLAASIYLMRKALPKAEIGPARPYVAGAQVGLAGTF